MKTILYIVMMTSVWGCNTIDNTSFTVKYFRKGNVEKISDFDSESFRSQIKGLFNNSERKLQLIVSDTLIEKIVEQNEGIEIIFEKTISIKSDISGYYEINKVLIPFDGKYAANDNNPRCVFFIAKGSYISGPLSCNNCEEMLRKIKISLILQ